MGNFSHLCILVTRPDPAGSTLCANLRALGSKAIHFPTIHFGPPDPTELQQALNTLQDQDWLIFISPQAVLAGLLAIHRHKGKIPRHIQLAAIGAGTAKALNKAGYTTIYPHEEWQSEGLLAMQEFQNVSGKKIAIVKGADGRKYLQEQLRERGAKVSNIIAYQRLLPEIDTAPYFKLVQNKQIDIIICASFHGIQNLKLLFDDEAWPYIKNIPFIVPSERVKILAQNLGLTTIWTARNASHTAILEVLGKNYGR